jgi:hypothetical protein
LSIVAAINFERLPARQLSIIEKPSDIFKDFIAVCRLSQKEQSVCPEII